MFRDASEELERLQAELLAEEEPTEQPPQEPEEEEYFDEYEDTRPARGPAVYRNYSNDYGNDLRNYASGYRAYNTDISDEDLEEYSEAVRSDDRKRGSGCLTAIAVFLALLLICLAAFWFAYDRGYIG